MTDKMGTHLTRPHFLLPKETPCHSPAKKADMETILPRSEVRFVMKPLLRALFTFLLFALTMSFLFACSQGSEQETGSSQTSHPPQTTEPPVNPPKLTELHVEGGYELSFSAEITSYTVQIPAGRPAVPQVSAKAEENASLTIHQATSPIRKRAVPRGLRSPRTGYPVIIQSPLSRMPRRASSFNMPMSTPMLRHIPPRRGKSLPFPAQIPRF